jgi:hypothetical protein
LSLDAVIALQHLQAVVRVAQVDPVAEDGEHTASGCDGGTEVDVHRDQHLVGVLHRSDKHSKADADPCRGRDRHGIRGGRGLGQRGGEHDRGEDADVAVALREVERVFCEGGLGAAHGVRMGARISRFIQIRERRGAVAAGGKARDYLQSHGVNLNAVSKQRVSRVNQGTHWVHVHVRENHDFVGGVRQRHNRVHATTGVCCGGDGDRDAHG